MGRGIARQVRDRWSGLADRYRKDGRQGLLARSYFGGSTTCNCSQQNPRMSDGHEVWCGSRNLPPDQTCLHFYIPQLATAGRQSDLYKLVMFPTKRSWKDKSDLSMIRLSLIKLSNLMKMVGWHVAIPLVGCGFGELSKDEVVPLIVEILGRFDDRVTLVLPDPSLRHSYPESFKDAGDLHDRSMSDADRQCLEKSLSAEAEALGLEE